VARSAIRATVFFAEMKRNLGDPPPDLGGYGDAGASTETDFNLLAAPVRLSHPGVFLVRLQLQAHEDVVVRVRLHVLHVIVQA